MSQKGDTRAVRLTLTLTKELKRRITQEAEKTFGKRQGALSLYVEMIFRNHYGMTLKGVEEK